MAEVQLTSTAADELEDLPLRIHARAVALLKRLELWPEVSGAKPLRGDLAGHYRLRTGDYRLPFRVEGETVIVEQIGHREGFYE